MNKLRRILLSAILVLFYYVSASSQDPYILVLGTAQDGGYPHLGCEKKCCNIAWENPEMKRFVVSLALVDPDLQSWYLFEATPDMADQIQYFKELTGGKYNYLPDGIFISHAHIGHYPGLMEFGREAMNSKEVLVYVLPRMESFLRDNGPWNQLVDLKNIKLKRLSENMHMKLSKNISIEIFKVPHRDEYSETAGYKIHTGATDYLFIPDIDKWSKWKKDIVKEVSDVDHAFIDGTFFSEKEIAGRNMEDIPHPFVIETMDLFKNKPADLKNKIHFIHLNHSNPLLYKHNTVKNIEERGFSIARQGKKY